MRIQHNIAAMNSYRNFSANTSALNKNLEKLSTGYKINRAGDDAAGLAISEKMRAQISGLEGATKNAKDGISLIQTAEGALTEVHDMLNRMTTLAEQSANGTYDDEVDRAQLQKEVEALKSEIDRIADSTNFNGLKLLDGGLSETTQALEISGSVNSTENLDMTDGVTINAPISGAGANQTYSIKFDKDALFGENDSISFEIMDSETSTRSTVKIDYKATVASSKSDFEGTDLKSQLESAAKALNYVDLAAPKTASGGLYNTGYTASVQENDDGSYSLMITADDPGTVTKKLENLSIDDKQVSSGNATGAVVLKGGGASTPMANESWALLGGSNQSFDVHAGDKLTFEFEINGNKMYAQITEGEDFFLDASDTTETSTQKIVDALNNAHFLNPSEGTVLVPNTKAKVSDGVYNGQSAGVVVSDDAAAYDNADDNLDTTVVGVTTTVDESQLKVSDYFTFEANKVNTNTTATADAGAPESATYTYGGIRASQNVSEGSPALASNGAYVNLGRAFVQNASTGATKEIAAVTTGANVAPGAVNAGAADAVGELTTVTVDSTQNFSVGEKFTVSGTLKDGRSFSVELDAIMAGTPEDDWGANQFAIGSNSTGVNTLADRVENSVKNIAAALVSDKTVVKITNADGSDGGTLKASDLFSDDGTNEDGKKTDFTVTQGGAGNKNKLLIQNTEAFITGTGVAAKIDSDNTGAMAANEISAKLNTDSVGADQGNAQNVLTFDTNKIEQGTTLKIDGKTYEFVSDAAYKTNDDNVAVVVDGLGDSATGEDIANALVGAMKGDTAAYTAQSGEKYDMTVKDSTLTITSQEVGEEIEALDVAMGENKATSVLNLTATDKSTLEEEKFVANVKAGDTVKIGGRTYEFTEGHRTSSEGNIQVDLMDDSGSKITDAATIAKKLASVVNENANTVSGDNPAIVARADGTKVVFTGKYNAKAGAGEDGYAAPNITLAGGSRKLKLQIGDTADDYNQLSVEVGDMHAEALGIGDVDVSSQTGAAEALDKIKAAVNSVSDVRGTLGALQNRLDHTINNLGVMRENIQNAESQIRDTDVAEEMMAYTKNSILNQSAQAMLAQANQLPQGVLQLLG